MKKHTFALISLLFTVSMLCSVLCWAVLPKSHYDKRKKEAAEHLTVEVIRIEMVKAGNHIEIEAEVKILKIHRSAKNLKQGNTIVIQWHRQTREPRVPIPGENSPVDLRINKKYTAFLNKTDRIRGYKPAAGRESFISITRPE